jgi:hypothetical protein
MSIKMTFTKNETLVRELETCKIQINKYTEENFNLKSKNIDLEAITISSKDLILQG